MDEWKMNEYTLITVRYGISWMLGLLHIVLLLSLCHDA